MESRNPAGSHKARSARFVIERAISEGHLTPGGKRRILEKTGGNFGVGLAYEAGRHNIGVDLVIGLSFSRVKRNLCEHFGARIVGDDLLNEGKSPREVVEQYLADGQNDYYFTDQFNNPANLEAHTVETGPEIVRQIKDEVGDTDKQIILVKGAGTGASFSGIAAALRETFANVALHLVVPDGCDLQASKFVDHTIEGITVGILPPFLDLSQIDLFHSATRDMAIQG